jgi:hypothetical protein
VRTHTVVAPLSAFVAKWHALLVENFLNTSIGTRLSPFRDQRVSAKTSLVAMKTSTRWVLVEVGVLIVGSAAGWSAGCAAGVNDFGLGFGADGGVLVADGSPVGTGQGTTPAGQCVECLSTANCGSDTCAQFQGDSYCAPSCTAGEGISSCPSGATCSIETAYNGIQVSVCVPDNNACGGGGQPGSSGPGSGGTQDSGAVNPPPVCVPATTGNCQGYAAPTTPSTCNSCSSSSSTCQPNGCYGGWYCDLTTSKCHAEPAGCSASAGASTTCPADAGGTTGTGTGAGSGSGTGTPSTITGSVTGTGGSVSSLLFAITGDTRPANVDDTSGYPTTIIDTIYSGIAARSPQPSFVVSTGDYQYSTAPVSSGQTSTSAPQIALYMGARAKYPGTWFPAMGNHECTGYTASNCGSGNSDGITDNYTNFLTSMLAPIGQTLPYYVIKINATDNSWTSKFVFIAANAWDSTQSSWLSTTLAETTTYTFVLRHEATEANTAPGVSPSDSIIAQHPLTLEICGHTHDVSKSGNKIVIGNGGAPLTGSGDYGYGLVTQRSDGAIIVDSIDYQTGAADSSFHFVVTPTGTLTN